MRISSQPVKWFCAAIGAAMLAAAPAAFAQSAEKPHLTRDSVATKAPPPKAIDYDKLTQEATAFLSKYIRINTTNPPGNELGAAQIAQGEISVRRNSRDHLGAGARPRNRRGAPARHRQASQGDHPAEPYGRGAGNPKEWEVPPFSGEVKDGDIWGRGAIDDKGPGVIEMMAMLAIKRAGILLDRDVIFIATGDEEEGGKIGAGWFVEHETNVFADAGYCSTRAAESRTPPAAKKSTTCRSPRRLPLWMRLTATGTAGPRGGAAGRHRGHPAGRALLEGDRLSAADSRDRSGARLLPRGRANSTHGPAQWLDLASRCAI